MKSLEKMEKLAVSFERKLEKIAQETTDEYAFQKWLNENFTSTDKNKIANNIANAIPDDLNSLSVNLSVNNGKLNIEATVNGAPSDIARKQVSNVVMPKLGPNAAKFPSGSKYSGWIKYPK